MKTLYLDPGKLRDRLTLFVNEETDDGCGGYESDWVERGAVWARILPAKATSTIRAGREEELVSHIIELRQPLDITARMRLTSAQPQRNFHVLTVSDPDETSRYWRCQCRLEGDQ